MFGSTDTRSELHWDEPRRVVRRSENDQAGVDHPNAIRIWWRGRGICRQGAEALARASTFGIVGPTLLQGFAAPDRGDVPSGRILKVVNHDAVAISYPPRNTRI